MIRLSRLADYGVNLMAHMAQTPESAHNAIDMVLVTGLPVPTVSKVLATLARHGLLVSQRGAKGGYSLARAPESITIAEIISAIEGPIALTNCIKSGPGNCEVEPVCSSRFSLHRINAALQSALSGVTLAEIAQPPRAPVAEPAPATGPRAAAL